MINKNLLLPGSPAIGFNSTHGKFVFVFFPTGSEFDLIGFLMLEEEETKKGGRVNVVGNSSNVVFIANKRLNQRIRGILVNHAAEDSNWLIDLIGLVERKKGCFIVYGLQELQELFRRECLLESQASDPCEPTPSLEFRTQRQTDFLLEAFRLQQRASETAHKLMALQTEIGKSTAQSYQF
ncbi:hypothetical protein LINPERHAP2_LOCUS28921 [Linum perenne]